MKTYSGERFPDGSTMVRVEYELGPHHIGTDLRERHDLVDYSRESTGFEWGYHGAGPASLALAILADVLGDSKAVRYHIDYRNQVVAKWEGGWSITEEEIRRLYPSDSVL